MHKLLSQLTIILSLVLPSGLLLAQKSSDTVAGTTSEVYFAYQTQKGRFQVGGDFGVGLGFRSPSFTLVNATTLIDASFSPRIGYFIAPKLLIGSSFDISNSLTVLEGQDQFELTNSTAQLLSRYYFKGGLFAEASYGWGWGHELRPIPNTNTLERLDFDSNRYAVGLGIANFWLERFSFEVLLRYSNVGGKYNDSDEGRMDFSGLAMKAGVGYSIGR